jgi:hypothetical protein
MDCFLPNTEKDDKTFYWLSLSLDHGTKNYHNIDQVFLTQLIAQQSMSNVVTITKKKKSIPSMILYTKYNQMTSREYFNKYEILPEIYGDTPLTQFDKDLIILFNDGG